MDKRIVLVCVFILNTSGQQIFLSKVNENEKKLGYEPKLYLSRENPSYRQNKTNVKPEEDDEDIEGLYTRAVLGLDSYPKQNGVNSRNTEVPTHGGHPIHIDEDSPLYRYFKNNHLESNRKNNHQKADSGINLGEIVLKKTPPVVLENGTFILGGYKIENPLPNVNVNSYKIKNIQIENQEPVVKSIRTIKFNGEIVTPKFLQNYFSQTFSDFTDDDDDDDVNDADTSANSPAKFEDRFNKYYDKKYEDGTGLIDVRSGFNIKPKVSKLSRRRELLHKNAT